MPRNGSGTSSVINTFVIDTIADPDTVNENFTDVADQLTNSLPRDGQTGMNAPLPLQNGTVAAPALTFSTDPDTGLYRASSNRINVALGGSGVPLGVGPNYSVKTGNYTAVVSDIGGLLRFTSSGTLSLDAAATLGANWHITVIADGGAVTIDPNGSETVNGATTLVVQNGAMTKIICDGSNFFASPRPASWELVEIKAVSALANIDFTDARYANATAIKISGVLTASAAAAITLRTSTNGGSSYDSGASDYSVQYQFTTGTAVTASGAVGTSINIGSTDLGQDTQFEFLLDNFNIAKACTVEGRSTGVLSSALIMQMTGGKRLQSTARNAFRILTNSGTLTGIVRAEIMRS